jgi:O-antigen ligase
VLIVTAAVVSVAVAAYANLPALATRVADALPTGFGGRIDVWRQTWPMARDFVLAGIGVGGYVRGMLVYQQSTRLIFINHAHNEYLQILVEGGLLLAVPTAAAVSTAAIATLRRLRCDRTPVFWLRAGAASGMAAVAAQCWWETGLRMPANAVLLAVIAAIALHAPPDSGSPSRT